MGKGVAQTLTTSCNQAVVEPSGYYSGTSKAFEGHPLKGLARTLKAEKHDSCVVFEDYKIRKLTPKECFRLMGLTDEQIDKVQTAKVNGKPISNSQQYKMAGNSIVVHQMKFLKNL